MSNAGAAVVDRGDSLADDAAAAAAPADAAAEAARLAAEADAAAKAAEADAAAKAAEKERDDKGRFIPKPRFDEAVQKEREARELAERRLAELEATLKKADVDAGAQKIEEEIAALEKDYSKLLLDGDHEAAALVLTQIRHKSTAAVEQRTAHIASQTREQTREEIRMDDAIAKLKADYPVLDEAGEAFDQEKVDDVLGWQRVYIDRDRLSPSAALLKAAGKIMSTTQAPAAPQSGLDAAKGTADAAGDRKAAQVAANIAAAAAQPASLHQSGIDSDKAGMKTDTVDVRKLSPEEFAALPEATKSRLRGDML